MDPDVEFFGVTVPPGKTVTCTATDEDADEETSLVHVTQFALGPSPSPGRHTILAVRSDGSEYAVGRLEAGRVDQFSADFMWSALGGGCDAGGSAADGGYGAVSFRHTGASPVHLTGYKTVSCLLDYGAGSEEEEEEQESEESEEESEEEGVVLREHGPGCHRPRARGGLVRLGAPGEESDEDDDDDDDDGDGDGDDDDDSSALSEDDDEEGGGSDGELDSEAEEGAPPAVPLIPKKAAPPKKGKRAAAPLAAGEPAGKELDLSSDDDGADEAGDGEDAWSDEEEEEEEESEDEAGLAAEEAAAAAALAGGSSSEEEEGAGVGGKRAAPPPATPPGPKKARAGGGPPKAATAGPATPPTPASAAAVGGGSGGSAAALYTAALASHLKASGPTRVANLGAAVKRPPAAPKLMKVLSGRKDVFALDAAGMVSLMSLKK